MESAGGRSAPASRGPDASFAHANAPVKRSSPVRLRKVPRRTEYISGIEPPRRGSRGTASGRRLPFPKPVSLSNRGVVAVFARSASLILLASALSAACGARSGIECFGETCRSLDDDDQQGFDPD